jgi:hypothetical protein
MMAYLVIRDTREKDGHGWIFGKQKDVCRGTVRQHLGSGDYSLEGYEDRLSIERKGSIAEFATNCVEKRFTKELERLEKIEYSFVLFEFTLDDLMRFPRSSDIPPYKWKYLKVKWPFILKRFTEMQMEFNTRFVFCGKYGRDMARSIFKRVIQND